MNKKTKLELAICHILQTKDWATTHEQINDFQDNWGVMRSLQWEGKTNAAVLLFECFRKTDKVESYFGFALSEEDLLTYYNQKESDFKNV